jgi:hypothetical protein
MERDNIKKLIIGSLLLTGLMLAGCGGGSSGGNGGDPSTGEVSGSIVGLDNTPVTGKTAVRLGTYATTLSDENGNFQFTAVPPGDYQIIISGGSGSNALEHLAGAAGIKVSAGRNQAGAIQVYNILSYGALSTDGGNSASSIRASGLVKNGLKNVISTEVSFYQPGTILMSQAVNFRAASINLTKANIAFVYINWKPLSGVTNPKYKIYFGASEDSQNLVWDSTKVGTDHKDDYSTAAPYDPVNPKAFLDLGDELAGKVSAAGIYQFRIIVYNEDGTKSKELPVIGVFIGMLMDSFPECKPLAGTTLSWTAVTGSSGYKAGIYKDAPMTQKIWESPDPLIPQAQASIALPSVVTSETTPTDYYWVVRAYAIDGAGWPTEVVAGTSAFRYP